MVMSRLATATTSMPALIARDMAVAVQDTSTRVSMKKKNRPATAWYPVKKQKDKSPLNNHIMNSNPWNTPGFLHKTGKSGRKTKFGVGRNYAWFKGPKSISKRCCQAGPCVRLLVSLPRPRVLQSHDANHNSKSAGGSSSSMLQIQESG